MGSRKASQNEESLSSEEVERVVQAGGTARAKVGTQDPAKNNKHWFQQEFPRLDPQTRLFFDLMVFSKVLIYSFNLNNFISKGNFILLPQLKNKYHFSRKRKVIESKNSTKF